MHLLKRSQGLFVFIWLALALLPLRGTGAQEGSRGARDRGVFAGLAIVLFSPCQSDFRDMYGPVIVHPQVRVGYFFSPGFFAFSTFEFFAVSGKTPELQLDSKLDQRVFSLGAGYRKKISAKLDGSAALSLLRLDWKERVQALDMENSSSCLGCSLEGALYCRFGQKIRGITSLSYMLVQKTIADVKARLGGFRLGFGALYFF
jgi:hypothetical protein